MGVDGFTKDQYDSLLKGLRSIIDDIENQSESLDEIRDNLLGYVDFLYCEEWDDNVDYNESD